MLYRACAKTFHSPRILRHLFTTLTAVGNFGEALLTLNTYIDLVGKAKERISKGGAEKDFDDDSTIILAIVEGIRVLCKYLNNGKRAMEIAEMLEEWLEEWRVITSDEGIDATIIKSPATGEEKPHPVSIVQPEVLCAAWRGIGVATSHWARQTVDAARRPEIQKSAEDAFRKGLDYDDEDIDCLFGLAMVLAETRHIEGGVDIIKQALMSLSNLKSEGEELAEGPDEQEAVASQYRRLAVPFWHLLALLLSASEEFEGALLVCDAVFEELGGEDNLRRASVTQTDAVGKGDPTRDMIMKMGLDEKENILEVKMTYMALVELMEGPDAALSMAEELLKLYSSLFYVSNLEGQIAKVQLAKQQQLEEQFKTLEVDVKPSRLRPMSRYSRLGRSQHKKQESGAASLLTEATARPTTSGSTVRPKSSHTTAAPQIQITDPNGGGTDKSISSVNSDGGKLHKRIGRANSVSGGTIRRRKSLGSVKSTTSSHGQAPQVPPIQADMKKVRRSPSLGSAPAPQPTAGNPPVPPLPNTPQTPTRTHIFHMHKHVKGPGANGGAPQSSMQSTDAPNIAVNIEDGASSSTAGQALGSPTEPTNRMRRTNRLFPLATRARESTLPEEAERTKFLACLRRVWLLIAGLYRRAKLFDETLQALDEAAKIKTVQETGEADLLAERGFLTLAQGKKEEALGHFENVLGYDWDHPAATVGLCQIILDLANEAGNKPPIAPPVLVQSQQQLQPPLTPAHPNSVYATPAQSPLLSKRVTFPPATPASSIPADATTSPSNTQPTTSDEEEDLAPLIARNRAFGLLSQLTKSGRGWDCSEAWFALARSYEEDGQIEKAKGVYWWCVGLEDTRPVRGWGGVSGGGVGTGRGWEGRVV